jgi:hypothetical protein
MPILVLRLLVAFVFIWGLFGGWALFVHHLGIRP